MRRIDQYELAIVVGIVCLFLAICFGIKNRFIPWNDEVQFAEPAANVCFHTGFISRQESNQSDRVLWVSNVPVYSIVLAAAFESLRFSLSVARCLNYLIMALAVFCTWAAIRQGTLLRQPEIRLLVVLMLLSGYGCYVCYANLRYDGLGLLECATALFIYTLPKSPIQSVGLFAVGVLMFWTNLQLLQYSLLLAVILTFAYSLRRTLLVNLRFLWSGFVVGASALLLLYADHDGALAAFRMNLEQQAGQSLSEKLRHLSYYFEYDASLAVLLVLLIAGFLIKGVRARPATRRAVIAGLLVSTLIPVIFFLARRFVFSSAWMVYGPVAICTGRVLEESFDGPRTWRLFAVICCVVSAVLGAPRAFVGILTDWNVRNYAIIQQFVEANIRPTDILFCDPAAYFAAKPVVERVYGPGYLAVMSTAEKKAMSLLMIDPASEAEVTRILGGHWTATARLSRVSRSSSERLLPLSSDFVCRLLVLRRSQADTTTPQQHR